MNLTVIIPTLNEAPTIGGLVGMLKRQNPDVRVVVADGGSTDETPEIARTAGAIVTYGLPSRGKQLIGGLAYACGEAVLFLHADTRLGRDGLAAIEDALSDDTVIGGNFRVIFDGDTKFAGWLTGFYARLRSRGLYYGDSAIFIRRTSLAAVGGIRPLDVMEDFDLVRRMEKAGRTVCIDNPPVITSSRRFQGRMPTAIFLQWVVLHALFLIGVPAKWLERIYRSKQHVPSEQV